MGVWIRCGNLPWHDGRSPMTISTDGWSCFFFQDSIPPDHSRYMHMYCICKTYILNDIYIIYNHIYIYILYLSTAMESQGMIATCYAAWRGATEEGKVRPAVRPCGALGEIIMVYWPLYMDITWYNIIMAIYFPLYLVFFLAITLMPTSD